jgi:hypothetical protein
VSKELRLPVFARFARSTLRSKRTVVRNASVESVYGVEKDFYKRVRDAIKKLHRNGGDLRELSEVPDRVSEARQGHSRAVANGFIAWAQAHDPEYFVPPKGTWRHRDVKVTVNPELGVVINGRPHILKLNYTAMPTHAEEAPVMAHLMHRTLGRRAPKGCRMGVLDVRTGRMVTTGRPKVAMDSVVEGCAAEVSALWDEAQAERV